MDQQGIYVTPTRSLISSSACVSRWLPHVLQVHQHLLGAGYTTGRCQHGGVTNELLRHTSLLAAAPLTATLPLVLVEPVDIRLESVKAFPLFLVQLENHAVGEFLHLVL